MTTGKPFRAIDRCRLCGAKELDQVWNLGAQWVMDCLEEGQAGFKAPLVVMFCLACGLAQLEHTVDRDLMYKKYWYRSGTSETMKQALKDVVVGALQYVSLEPGDIVLDIGANDGELLSRFPDTVIKTGCEPANNLYEDLEKVADVIIPTYWSYKAYVTERTTTHRGRKGGTESIPPHRTGEAENQPEQR